MSLPGHGEGDDDDDREPEQQGVSGLPSVRVVRVLGLEQGHHELQVRHLVGQVPHHDLVAPHLREYGSDNSGEIYFYFYIIYCFII